MSYKTGCFRAFLTFVCFISFCGQTFSDVQGASVSQKYAILIGISHYQDSHWRDVNCKPDVDSIHLALVNRGFKEDHIIELLDAKATKDGVVKALTDLQKRIRSGNIVYVHFSGHGTRIRDENNDEDDDYDEALVMYDGQFEGETGLLIDDELGKFIQNFGDIVGSRGQVILSIDAPHAGPEDYIKDNSAGLFIQPRGGIINDIDFSVEESSIIVLSASLANELSTEIHGMGAWSYAFVKALRSPDVKTFADLQNSILKTYEDEKIKMGTPTISGDVSRDLFHLREFSLVANGNFTKRALLIGVSEYKYGILRRKASVSDVNSLAEALLEQGFTKDHIAKLIDSNATKAAVLEAIHNLTFEAQPGDIIHIHFSCTGTHFKDDNGDEKDGFDEAFALYDALIGATDPVNMGYLSDDEFGSLIKPLAEKVGSTGQVIVSADAEYSGSDEKEVSPSGNAQVKTRGGLFEELMTDNSPVLFFSSNLSWQYSQSYKGMGLWTYAYIEALRESNPGDYSDIQQYIAKKYSELGFSEKATPTLSGDDFRLVYSQNPYQLRSFTQFKKVHKQSNFYVLSIGISNYHYQNLDGSAYNNCKGDAVRYSQMIEEQFQMYGAPAERTFKSFVLLDEQATLSGIINAINTIANEAERNDYFFLSFSGHTAEMKDSLGNDELYIMPYVAQNSGVKIETGNIDRYGFSLRALSDLLVFIPCQNQLIISEAGSSEKFTRLFTKALIETSQSIMDIERRNRVIIVPKFIGLDQTRCMSEIIEAGPINYFINEVGSTKCLLNLFHENKQEREKMAYQILKTETACGFGSPYVEIFFERDIIDNLQFFMEGNAMQSRGGRSRSTRTDSSAKAAFGSKYALLIGSNNYQKGRPTWQDLTNPIVDAKAIANLLKLNFGYEVELLLDPTANEIIKALSLISKNLKENDQFICFIAGHGDYDPDFFDDGFMVLSESMSLSKDPYRRSYLPFSQVGNIIDNLPCKQVLLMVDVCFGGAFDQKLSNGPMRSKNSVYDDVSIDEVIKSHSTKTTRIVVSSGSLNVVPDGYHLKHSPFAFRMIAALESKGGSSGVITSNQLYEMVSRLPSKPFKGELKGNEPGSEFFLIGTDE